MWHSTTASGRAPQLVQHDVQDALADALPSGHVDEQRETQCPLAGQRRGALFLAAVKFG